MIDDLYLDGMSLILLIPMWVHAIAAILACGVGRAMVGDGAWSRGIVYPVTCGYAALVGFGFSWWALAFAAVTAVTLSSGFTKWQDKPFMALRYGLPTLALGAVYIGMAHWPLNGADLAPVGGILAWVACCAVAGYFYSTIQETFADDPADWLYDPEEVDSSRVAEFIAGCVIQGGPALLRYALPT